MVSLQFKVLTNISSCLRQILNSQPNLELKTILFGSDICLIGCCKTLTPDTQTPCVYLGKVKKHQHSILTTTGQTGGFPEMLPFYIRIYILYTLSYQNSVRKSWWPNVSWEYFSTIPTHLLTWNLCQGLILLIRFTNCIPDSHSERSAQ